MQAYLQLEVQVHYNYEGFLFLILIQSVLNVVRVNGEVTDWFDVNSGTGQRDIYTYHRRLAGGTKYCTRVRVQYFIYPPAGYILSSEHSQPDVTRHSARVMDMQIDSFFCYVI